MTVIPLATYRRRRAHRQAAAVGHPTVVGGPHAAVLRRVVEDLMPAGYHAGLWQIGSGRAAHALRPVEEWEVTRCGVSAPAGAARRAGTALHPCRRCFPS